jgi:hypothetical protein
VREAIEVVRALLPRLSGLGPDELGALDDASIRLHQESRGLWQDVLTAESDGPAA